ncbi:MAG: GntP family permease, partial [Pseudoalteromonas spongiae]
MLSMLGLIGGLALLIVLTLRGMNLFIAAPACALIVALTSNLAIFPSAGADNFIQGYMNGFANFVSAWFFMFLLGSLFGKFMEDTGAADSVARYIVDKLGMKHAVLAIVIACAVLTYGGVSVFIVAFSVYPMALSLFKDANLPRRFIPATLAFGSVTFTMTSAGSPEIQNWIPIKYLGTSPYAAWEVSLVVAIFMACFGYWWLKKMIGKAVANGEQFEARDDDPEIPERDYPHPVTGLIPLLVVLALSFILHDSLQQAA